MSANSTVNANANANTNASTAQLVSEGAPNSPHLDGLTVASPPAPPAAPALAPAHPINININGSPLTVSSPTRPRIKITDHDFPQDATLFLGELEPWMDEHYLVQVCSLLGWDTIKMHIPRPPVAANATRHPNNSGYALLIMANPDAALRVWHQFGPDAAPTHTHTHNTTSPTPQPILLPNSNHPIKIDWADSPLAQTAIGKELGPVDNAIEYSIFVGDLAGDVTNADLMNVFRNPNLGLRGDFPPRLIAPFHSCCNAKVMVDSFSGVSKGYGFVRSVLFPLLSSIGDATASATYHFYFYFYSIAPRSVLFPIGRDVWFVCIPLLTRRCLRCATDSRVRLIKFAHSQRCKASTASLVPVCQYLTRSVFLF